MTRKYRMLIDLLNSPCGRFNEVFWKSNFKRSHQKRSLKMPHAKEFGGYMQEYPFPKRSQGSYVCTFCGASHEDPLWADGTNRNPSLQACLNCNKAFQWIHVRLTIASWYFEEEKNLTADGFAILRQISFDLLFETPDSKNAGIAFSIMRKNMYKKFRYPGIFTYLKRYACATAIKGIEEGDQ